MSGRLFRNCIFSQVVRHRLVDTLMAPGVMINERKPHFFLVKCKSNRL